MTYLINFGHPLSAEALTALESYGVQEGTVIDIRVQLDMNAPLAPQMEKIADDIPFDQQRWATEPVLVCLPGASVAAGLILAIFHGRMGGFSRVISLNRGEDGIFRLAEVIDLQFVRNHARLSR